MKLATAALVLTSAVLAGVALPTTAHAQVAFPRDEDWFTLRCNRQTMTDRYQDEPGAFAERDIVGNIGASAGERFADDTYLYLRIRLDQDPAPGGAVRPFAWGMLFDLDGDLTSYELMVVVSGIDGPAGTISIHRNTTTTVANSPDDPADQPAVVSYPFAGNARSVVAVGTANGGDADFFLEFAVPWSDLRPLGLDRKTQTRVWVATSSVATSFDGDLACHDGGTGGVHLDGETSDPTTGDPVEDPNNPTPVDPGGAGGTGQLQGGGGCTTGSPDSLISALGALAGLALRRRRARRATEPTTGACRVG